MAGKNTVYINIDATLKDFEKKLRDVQTQMNTLTDNKKIEKSVRTELDKLASEYGKTTEEIIRDSNTIINSVDFDGYSKRITETFEHLAVAIEELMSGLPADGRKYMNNLLDNILSGRDQITDAFRTIVDLSEVALGKSTNIEFDVSTRKFEVSLRKIKDLASRELQAVQEEAYGGKIIERMFFEDEQAAKKYISEIQVKFEEARKTFQKYKEKGIVGYDSLVWGKLTDDEKIEITEAMQSMRTYILQYGSIIQEFKNAGNISFTEAAKDIYNSYQSVFSEQIKQGIEWLEELKQEQSLIVDTFKLKNGAIEIPVNLLSEHRTEALKNKLIRKIGELQDAADETPILIKFEAAEIDKAITNPIERVGDSFLGDFKQILVSFIDKMNETVDFMYRIRKELGITRYSQQVLDQYDVKAYRDKIQDASKMMYLKLATEFATQYANEFVNNKDEYDRLLANVRSEYNKYLDVNHLGGKDSQYIRLRANTNIDKKRLEESSDIDWAVYDSIFKRVVDETVKQVRNSYYDLLLEQQAQRLYVKDITEASSVEVQNAMKELQDVEAQLTQKQIALDDLKIAESAFRPVVDKLTEILSSVENIYHSIINPDKQNKNQGTLYETIKNMMYGTYVQTMGKDKSAVERSIMFNSQTGESTSGFNIGGSVGNPAVITSKDLLIEALKNEENELRLTQERIDEIYNEMTTDVEKTSSMYKKFDTVLHIHPAINSKEANLDFSIADLNAFNQQLKDSKGITNKIAILSKGMVKEFDATGVEQSKFYESMLIFQEFRIKFEELIKAYNLANKNLADAKAQLTTATPLTQILAQNKYDAASNSLDAAKSGMLKLANDYGVNETDLSKVADAVFRKVFSSAFDNIDERLRVFKADDYFEKFKKNGELLSSAQIDTVVGEFIRALQSIEKIDKVITTLSDEIKNFNTAIPTDSIEQISATVNSLSESVNQFSIIMSGNGLSSLSDISSALGSVKDGEIKSLLETITEINNVLSEIVTKVGLTTVNIESSEKSTASILKRFDSIKWGKTKIAWEELNNLAIANLPEASEKYNNGEIETLYKSKSSVAYKTIELRNYIDKLVDDLRLADIDISEWENKWMTSLNEEFNGKNTSMNESSLKNLSNLISSLTSSTAVGDVSGQLEELIPQFENSEWLTKLGKLAENLERLANISPNSSFNDFVNQIKDLSKILTTNGIPLNGFEIPSNEPISFDNIINPEDILKEAFGGGNEWTPLKESINPTNGAISRIYKNYYGQLVRTLQFPGLDEIVSDVSTYYEKVENELIKAQLEIDNLTSKRKRKTSKNPNYDTSGINSRINLLQDYLDELMKEIDRYEEYPVYNFDKNRLNQRMSSARANNDAKLLMQENEADAKQAEREQARFDRLESKRKKSLVALSSFYQNFNDIVENNDKQKNSKLSQEHVKDLKKDLDEYKTLLDELINSTGYDEDLINSINLAKENIKNKRNRYVKEDRVNTGVLSGQDVETRYTNVSNTLQKMRNNMEALAVDTSEFEEHAANIDKVLNAEHTAAGVEELNKELQILGGIVAKLTSENRKVKRDSKVDDAVNAHNAQQELDRVKYEQQQKLEAEKTHNDYLSQYEKDYRELLKAQDAQAKIDEDVIKEAVRIEKERIEAKQMLAEDEKKASEKKHNDYQHLLENLLRQQDEQQKTSDKVAKESARIETERVEAEQKLAEDEAQAKQKQLDDYRNEYIDLLKAQDAQAKIDEQVVKEYARQRLEEEQARKRLAEDKLKANEIRHNEMQKELEAAFSVDRDAAYQVDKILPSTINKIISLTKKAESGTANAKELADLERAKTRVEEIKKAFENNEYNLPEFLNKEYLDEVNKRYSEMSSAIKRIEELKKPRATLSGYSMDDLWGKNDVITEMLNSLKNSDDIDLQKLGNDIKKINNITSTTKANNKEVAMTVEMVDGSIRKLVLTEKDGVIQFKEMNVQTQEQGKSIAGLLVQNMAYYFSLRQLFGYIRSGFGILKEYNDALTSISYTMDISKEQLSELGKEALAMSEDLGISTQNAMEIVQIYANMNTTAEEMLKTAEPTAILSNLTGIDAKTAANDIQAVVQQFNIAADDTMHIVDVYDKLSAGIAVDYAQGIENIAEGVQIVGDTARQAGLSFEQLGAIIAKTSERTRMEGSQIAKMLARHMVTYVVNIFNCRKLLRAFHHNNREIIL